MIRYETGRGYAQALFNISTSPEQLKSRVELLTALTALWREAPAFAQFFLNPEIGLEEKEKVLEKGIADKELMHFLLLLLARRRFKYLPEIAARYRELVALKNGQLLATLESATPVDAAFKTHLQELLKKNFGKDLLLHTEEAPQLMGGAILIVGNKILDGSLKGRFDRMKKTLEGKS